MDRKVKFGVFADLHVDIIHDGLERLETFLEACRKENVDFLIQLGDFCYPDEGRKCVCKPENMPVNIANALKRPVAAEKDKIRDLYLNFGKPAYHVIGNHDCDMCSKKQILEYHGVPYGPYYSFDNGGFHFVVIDANYMRLDGKDISYENGNYFDESYRPANDRVIPFVAREELDWLEKDLASTAYPSVLFSHQRLCPGPASILNVDEFTAVISKAPHKVVMSVNGHEHVDNAELIDGVWYYNLNSISMFWVDEKYARLNRYGAEIDEKYPDIRHTLPYSTAQFAIITMDENGASVKGTTGEYVGPSAKDIDYRGGGSEFVSPCVKDRYMPFSL